MFTEHLLGTFSHISFHFILKTTLCDKYLLTRKQAQIHSVFSRSHVGL